MTTPYYKPSGKINSVFFAYYAIFSLITIPLLSLAYVYLVYYIPYIYVNLFTAIGCGAVMGLAVKFAVQLGKITNRAIVFTTALVSSFILLYVQWCIHIPLVYSEVYGFYTNFAGRFEETMILLVRPGLVFEVINEINYYGVWGIGESGDAITGVLLTIIWILEFLIIAACSLIIPAIQLNRPFSDEANGWYTKEKKTTQMNIPTNFELMKKELEEGQYDNFKQWVSFGKTDDTRFQTLIFFSPPQGADNAPYYMTITQSVMEKKNKINNITLVTNLRIDPQVAREVLDNTITSQPATPTPSQFCQSCGNPHEPDEKFCGTCGGATHPPEQ